MRMSQYATTKGNYLYFCKDESTRLIPVFKIDWGRKRAIRRAKSDHFFGKERSFFLHKVVFNELEKSGVEEIIIETNRKKYSATLDDWKKNGKEIKNAWGEQIGLQTSQMSGEVKH